MKALLAVADGRERQRSTDRFRAYRSKAIEYLCTAALRWWKKTFPLDMSLILILKMYCRKESKIQAFVGSLPLFSWHDFIFTAHVTRVGFVRMPRFSRRLVEPEIIMKTSENQPRQWFLPFSDQHHILIHIYLSCISLIWKRGIDLKIIDRKIDRYLITLPERFIMEKKVFFLWWRAASSVFCGCAVDAILFIHSFISAICKETK